MRGRGARGLRVVCLESLEDATVRVDGSVRAGVRLQPLLARRAQDIPDDGEHRDEQLVTRGLADDLVEACVFLRIRLAGLHLRRLAVEDLAQLVELLPRDALRRARRDVRLDEAADLDDLLEPVSARDERCQGPGDRLRSDLSVE